MMLLRRIQKPLKTNDINWVSQARELYPKDFIDEYIFNIQEDGAGEKSMRI